MLLVASVIRILYTSLPPMGSSSVTEPAAAASNSSTESLNGLKFGQKIYFEDVGAGAPAKSSGGASSSSSGATPPKKGRGCGVQGAQPPRCQVEGCRVDLSDAKAYYSRHKVCSMHSKSPKVVIAGQEQRFCQQCSRFHQLSEFDQVKRSCRRRLAGHNERRRKPPPSSLLASRYGRLSPANFDSSSRGGGFVMEFASFPKLSLRNPMASPTSSEQVAGNPSVTVPWQGNSESPSLLFLQAGCSSSVSGTGFCGSRNSSSGESFAGMTDSSCALSLLSNQAWAPRNRAPSLGMNNFMNFDDTPITQLAAPSSHHAHGPSIHHHLSNASWCFKCVDGAGNCSHEIVPDLGLGHQISHPMSSPLAEEIDVSQQGRRHYMDLEQSRAYDDSQHHMHWSL